jgi:putative methionine-R-sulfoxide reductase with GAF domain
MRFPMPEAHGVDEAMTHVDSADESSDEALGLAAGLAGLSRLVSDSGSVDDLLSQVASFTIQSVRGADGVGVTVIEAGEPDTVVASAPFVRDVDSVQYRLGEGPCISAAATGHTNGSGALGEDAAWPRFGPRAAELGVQSALSLPLILDGQVLGSLNVYAHDRNAFGESARRAGELFASPAGVAIHNAQVLFRARRAIARMQVALTNRATIDQAIGIIRSRSGVSATEAVAKLEATSQREHVALSLVAAHLVQDAVQRAQVRRTQT